MTIAAITAAHSGMNEKDRLAQGEAILSDKINGMPMSAIMEKHGVSLSTAHRRIDRAVAARIAPTVDAYREQMNAAYDEQVERINRHLVAAMVMVEQATVAGDMDLMDRGMVHHLKAIEQLNRTREAQRRLNGLDAPVRTDVHLTVTTPLDASIESLVSQLDAPVAG